MRHALVNDDLDAVDRYFLQFGARNPVVVWNPEHDQLEDERLQRLSSYWQEKAGDQTAAPVASIDPTDMRFVLGYLMLLDVLEDGYDFRYRLYGTMISERFGRDVTGTTIREFGDKAYIVSFFLGAYQAVMERRAPLLTIHYPKNASETESWTRLILPLEDENNKIARLLVGQIPGEWRPRPAGAEAPAF
ncbi:PAS domain-containing protein [Nisaea nitritireducens]|uniref:PAS domain-containing protein n=1 Tax=Nisaea nitritireducens TaxID=568392 RepID=UPI00186793B3|nr:PAS domain-containing protein [Nisaea nitritireducens]